MKSFHQAPAVYTGAVYLNVLDLNAMKNFYTDIIGFRVLSETDSRIELTADGNTPLLVLENREGLHPKRPNRAGLYHFAILLPSREDLGAAILHFIRKGVRMGASDHYVSEALYLNDPEGNGIEVYRDRPADEWNWNDGQVEMATVALDGDGVVRSAQEAGRTWNGLPAETVMGHVHLHVSNLDETERFYRDGLGFEVATYYPGALFMSTARYHHHLGLNVWNGEGVPAQEKDSAGLKAYTLVFPDSEAVRKVSEQLRSIGAEVSEEDGQTVAADPSGNRIILQAGA
ncbi:VOC family protein [Bhargavaea massiliensis]|uniref:VOC family protein n=1 Tax=Bhargavaea massiliensis TaxID=2697500 RepID=UPI001BCAA475|nr:VOC family protein [Bhargavaea massiliensis]